MRLHRFLVMAVLVAAIAVSVSAETPVTSDAAEQQAAVVSGHNVAWMDYRNGNWDIYMKNLTSGIETRVSSSAENEVSPDIDGGRIVYQLGVGDILLYDIATGGTSTITAADGEQSLPRVSGDWVVWQDHRGSDWDVYCYNLGTHLESKLTGTGNQRSPSVEGDQMVWVSQTALDSASVIAYNTTTSTQTVIASLSHPSYPDVSAGRVTYLNWDDAIEEGLTKVFYRSIAGGTPDYIHVVAGNHEGGGQRIDGSRVVFSADAGTGDGWDIWVYDLSSGVATQVTANGAGVVDWNPAIDGGRVVYESIRNGNWDIYTEVIGEEPAILPGGSATPTDTNADGKYDDINGNLRRDFADVVLYFNQMTWISANEPVSLFDYNGNSRIDFADVVWLFNHL